MALDWRSAALACTADPAWRRKVFHGGLMLLIPFLGWPLVLGYRRLFAERLLDRGMPLLPEWRGNHALALRHGLAAMGVIHGYYAPLYLWLAVRTTNWQLWAQLPWGWLLLFVVALPIFSTLIVPAWLWWLRWGAAVGPEVPDGELALLGVLLAAITFVIPAGFLRVSQTRRASSAFHLIESVRLIARGPRRYVEAWIGSGVMSLAAHFCLPLAPWAVFWCYLSIIYCFNELEDRDGARRADGSWFRYFRNDHWVGYDASRGRLVEILVLREPVPMPLGRPEPTVRALCVGPIRLLLP